MQEETLNEVSEPRAFFEDAEYTWSECPEEWSEPQNITDMRIAKDITRCASTRVPQDASVEEKKRIRRRIQIAAIVGGKLPQGIKDQIRAEVAKVGAISAVQKSGELLVKAGELDKAVDNVSKILGKSGLYFHRGNSVVRLLTLPEDAEDDHMTKRAAGSVIIKRAEPPAIAFDISRMADVKTWNTTKGKWVSNDLPADVSKSFLAVGLEHSAIRQLLGIVHAPIMRDDGVFIVTRGYDRTTKLYLDANLPELDVPERPTHEDACAAAAWLYEEIYGEFKTDAVGKSVIMSSLFSAILRPYVNGSPLHSFDAPSYGAGKSKLAEIAGIVATGVKPAMTPPGERQEETMKRVESMLRAGDAICVMDNISEPLTGNSLCTLMTAENVNIRVFGTNTMVALQSASFWMATGQNLTIRADMVRRSLIARIDPGVERPEHTVFKKSDLIGWVRSNRIEILTKMYLIFRAHAQAGFPHGDGAAPLLGSFEGWAKRVAGLCTWVGMGNPLDSQERLYEDDPLRAKRSSVLDAIYDWQERRRGDGGVDLRDEPWLASKLLEVARGEVDGALYEFVANEFSRTKIGVNDIKTPQLTGWFRRIKDQVTGGLKMTVAGYDKALKVSKWLVVRVTGSDASADDDVADGSDEAVGVSMIEKRDYGDGFGIERKA